MHIFGLNSRPVEIGVFVVALLLVGRQALSYAGWGAIDLMARLHLWPRDVFEFDAYGYVSSVSPVHAVVFWLAVICFMAAFIALILRSRFALHLLILSLVPGIGDWVLLTTVPQLMNDMAGYLHLIGHLLAICALIFLRQRGVLR